MHFFTFFIIINHFYSNSHNEGVGCPPLFLIQNSNFEIFLYLIPIFKICFFLKLLIFYQNLKYIFLKLMFLSLPFSHKMETFRSVMIVLNFKFLID